MYYPVVASRVSPQRRLFYRSVAVLLLALGIGYTVRTFVPMRRINGSWILQVGSKRYRLQIGAQAPVAALPPAPSTPQPVVGDIDDMTLLRAPSIAPEIINRELVGTPAAGTGAIWVAEGQQYGIDPAYALAFFVHESSKGMNPNWAGIKPDGTTHNIGNIICAGYPTCYGRFRDYATWDDGIADWFRLIKVEYIEGRGLRTVADVLPIYAPPEDSNDVPGYIAAVEDLVRTWRQQTHDLVLAPIQMPVAQATSSTLTASGDFGTVVRLALNANNGAIKDFTLAPGATWSFGHSIAPLSVMGNLPVVNGVPAGGWCNVAALYVEVADQLGLASVVPSHEGGYGPRFPGIWLNDDGSGANSDGSGDLTITNTTKHVIVFHVTIDGDIFQVSAYIR